MERKDVNLNTIQRVADSFFRVNGTGRGSGYKQYQRWLYERKFHTDAKGNFIEPSFEEKTYRDFQNQSKKYKAGPTITWAELGPKKWTYTSSWNPGVGRVTSVAVHPSDTTVIYVSSPGGGIWKSTNSGTAWTPLIDQVNSSWMNVFHLCIDPSDPKVLYASAGGVIKSTNSGSSWSSTGNGPNSTKKVVVHPKNSSILLAAATNGIWRSVNGGTSWTRVETADEEDIEFNPVNPSIVYASGGGSSKNVLRSTDNGLTWKDIGSAGGITSTGRTLLGVSPKNPAIVYAVQASGSLFGKFYKSTDTGKTYSTLITGDPAQGTNFFGYSTDGKGTTGQAWYDMAICVNPKDADEVHIAGILVWKSSNGGSSFTAETVWTYPNSTGYNHADVHALEWVKSTIYSGSDGGIFKSVNNGDDWLDLSTGLGIRQFYRISCAKTDPNMIAGGAQDNGSSIRRSNGTWYDWLGADGMDNCISPINSSYAIGTSQNGGIYKTTNAGSGYSGLTQPSAGNWVTPLAMHPLTHDTVFGGWTGVWKSVDFGKTWKDISAGTITERMDALAVAPSDAHYLYASAGSKLYYSANGGTSWSSVTAPATITSICVSPSDPKKIWITCNSLSSRVLVSTNMGASFTDISSGLPSLPARRVVVEDTKWEGIYVGMNLGVYYRNKISSTWVQHGSGLPLVSINDLEISKIAGKLRVATYGRGVWESDLWVVEICSSPSKPLNTNISATEATVSWSKGGSDKRYLFEYRAGSSGTWTVKSLTDTFMTLSGLNTGTLYLWRVKSICTYDTSDYLNSSFRTQSVCPYPANFRIGSIGQKTATILWSGVNGAKGYRFDYRIKTSGTWSGPYHLTDTLFRLSGLVPGIEYECRVLTKCSSDSSIFNSISFTTLPPCGKPDSIGYFSLSPVSITLYWTPVPKILGYEFRYRAKGSPVWENTYQTNDTSFILFGLNHGTLYEWELRTHCAEDSSAYLPVTFITPCQQPTGLTVSQQGTTSATLNWRSVPGVRGYNLFYKTKDSLSWKGPYSAKDSFYVLNDLIPGTSYDWKVGSECVTGPGESSQSTLTTLFPCLAPERLMFGERTPKGLNLNWKPVRGATEYILDYKPVAEATWSNTRKTADTSFLLTKVSPGYYHLRLQAVCASGNSGYVADSFIIHCNSFATDTGKLLIDRVALGNIDRVSGSDGGYFAQDKPLINLISGTTASIILSAASKQPVAGFWSVYIDYNRNGSFTENGETVLEFRSSTKQDTTLKFKLPENVVPGIAGMRVSLKSGSAASPCETFGAGEVEDYRILLEKGTSTTGYNRIETGEGVRIYPVPASHSLYLEALTAGLKIRTTEVMDISGKLVFIQKPEEAGDQRYKLDISSLSEGMYLLRIKTTEGQIMRNFVVKN